MYLNTTMTLAEGWACTLPLLSRRPPRITAPTSGLLPGTPFRFETEKDVFMQLLVLAKSVVLPKIITAL